MYSYIKKKREGEGNFPFSCCFFRLRCNRTLCIQESGMKFSDGSKIWRRKDKKNDGRKSSDRMTGHWTFSFSEKKIQDFYIDLNFEVERNNQIGNVAEPRTLSAYWHCLICITPDLASNSNSPPTSSQFSQENQIAIKSWINIFILWGRINKENGGVGEEGGGVINQPHTKKFE